MRPRYSAWACAVISLALGAAGCGHPIGMASRGQPTDCINNLRRIDSAKTQFAIEHRKHDGDLVTMEELTPYRGTANLVCPAGGVYQIKPIGVDPVCSLATNQVSWHRGGVLSYTYSGTSGNMHRLP